MIADDLAAIESDLDHERYKSAIARTDAIALDALSSADWETVVPIALRCRIYSGEAVDRVIVDARRWLPRAATDEGRAQIHAQIAYALVAKRCRSLASAEADACDRLSSSSLGPSVRGWIALAFDDRDIALDAYLEASARPEPHRGWMGLARVRYVVGDFDGALDALRHLDHPRTRCGALRLRADIARVRADWGAHLDLIEAILAATPDGDHRRSDLLDRASALIALDRRDEGLAQYRELWRSGETDEVGRFAREVLDRVERGGGAGARVMLPRFPTVAQKRNYCGPASLELVLRSLGIDVDQDDIAPEVKRERGSPILMMTQYLESHGLETRRFEGDAARFRACIEKGFPVIVEEEYSISSHVAVVIGVDEGLGILYVQDPMTHVTSERLLKTQGSLVAMYRGAAIVAFRPDDTDTELSLDAAGVIDQPHLRLVDSCAAPELAEDFEEILRRCSRALELVEDYPLAWYRRLQALWSQALRTRTGNNLSRFVGELRRARVRYHDQEWPHLLHAAYLMDDARFDEALIELEHALRIDPHDSNTAQDVAECHMQAGRRDEATTAFWKALEIDPTHVRATENFGGHALDGGDVELAAHLAACALEMAPNNPFNHLTASRVARAQGRDDDALASARRCCEIAPEYVHGPLHLASLLASLPSEDAQTEATQLYLDQSKKHPYWFEPRWRGARRLERAGEVTAAVELLLAGLEVAQDDPVDLVRPLTEILLEAGDEDGAVEMAERFASQRPTVAMLEALWDTLRATDRTARVREATAEFLASNTRSPFANAQHAASLIGLGAEEDAEAERCLRVALAGSPSYHWARRKLAELLARDRADEAIATLDEAPPGDNLVRVLAAGILCDQHRYADALARLDGLEEDGFATQDAWQRAWLADRSPSEAAAAVTGPARRVALAKFAFLIAAGAWSEAEAAATALPTGDVHAHDLLVLAVGGADRFRPLFERELEAAVASPSLGHVRRRYSAALLDGSRAARGDRAGLDARLAGENNPRRVVDVLRALDEIRQAALVQEVREAVCAKFAHPSAQVEGAFAAAMRGDHATALARARRALESAPAHKVARMIVALESALAGDLDGARDAAAWLERMTEPLPGFLTAAALVRLLDGDRDGADRLSARAAHMLTGWGFAPDVLPMTSALRAVLRGDLADLERLRQRPAGHHDPASPLWAQLAALAKP